MGKERRRKERRRKRRKERRRKERRRKRRKTASLSPLPSRRGTPTLASRQIGR